MESQNHFLWLIDKYISGAITQAEQDELFILIATGEYDQLFEEHFKTSFHRSTIEGANMPSQRARDIMQYILHSEKHTVRLLPAIFRKKRIVRWSVAASIVGLLVLTALLLTTKEKDRNASTARGQIANILIEQKNGSNGTQQIKLEDGTLVSLRPGSSIRFLPHFSSDKREVYLRGEAFFKVSKNPNRPFLVYYNDLITHVLGTSFNIKTDSVKKEVEVSVVTGKVHVYEKGNSLTTGSNKVNGVILTPNQKVVYNEEERQFTATIVNDPLPVVKETIKKTDHLPSFNFEESRLTDVFKSLENTYGLEIVVDNNHLYNCLFTGDINQYGLFTKLNIICASVKASYEVVGTKILIKGRGCDLQESK
jgi:transmembrane sensor